MRSLLWGHWAHLSLLARLGYFGLFFVLPWGTALLTVRYILRGARPSGSTPITGTLLGPSENKPETKTRG